jgi:hypothetical protein
MQLSMFNVAHYPQILRSIIPVNPIPVVHLFVFFQGLNKRIGNKPMDQERLAGLSSYAPVPEPDLNVGLGPAVVLFCGQRHYFFWDRDFTSASASANSRKGFNPPQVAYLVSALVVANIGPHFVDLSISSVALMLLHGYPFQIFLRWVPF